MTFPAILQKVEKICIIAPHQDDEIFGLGGTICKLLALKKKIHIIFLTDGGRGIKHIPRFLCKQIRMREFLRINETLKDLYKTNLQVKFLNFKDGELLTDIDDCSELLREAFFESQIDLIFIPNPNDWHPDHKAGYEASIKAIRGTSIQCLIYGFFRVRNGYKDIIKV